MFSYTSRLFGNEGTLVTSVYKTFMFRLPVYFKTALLCSLVVTLVTWSIRNWVKGPGAFSAKLFQERSSLSSTILLMQWLLLVEGGHSVLKMIVFFN